MTSIRQHPMVAGTSTTEGTVGYQITGDFNEFLSWSTIANGRKIRYVARDGAQFEENYGVVSTGPVLSRDTVLRTSNNDTTRIDWGSGTRIVYPVPDIDTVFEADDGTFVKMLKAPQVESVDGGGTTRRFRFWSDEGIMYLSDSTVSPFTHLLKLDAEAATPTLISEKPVASTVSFDAPVIKQNGTSLTAPATAPFATEAEADAGAYTNVVMSPLRVQNTIASYAPAIGNRIERTTAEYTDMVHVGVPSTGNMRKMSLATIANLFRVPFTQTLSTWAVSTAYAYSHGLSAEPEIVEIWYVPKTEQLGFFPSQRVRADYTQYGNNNRGPQIWKSATQIGFRLNASAPEIMDRITGTITSIDDTNWSILLVARL